MELAFLHALFLYLASLPLSIIAWNTLKVTLYTEPKSVSLGSPVLVCSSLQSFNLWSLVNFQDEMSLTDFYHTAVVHNKKVFIWNYEEQHLLEGSDGKLHFEFPTTYQPSSSVE